MSMILKDLISLLCQFFLKRGPPTICISRNLLKMHRDVPLQPYWSRRLAPQFVLWHNSMWPQCMLRFENHCSTAFQSKTEEFKWLSKQSSINKMKIPYQAVVVKGWNLLGGKAAGLDWSQEEGPALTQEMLVGLS